MAPYFIYNFLKNYTVLKHNRYVNIFGKSSFI